MAKREDVSENYVVLNGVPSHLGHCKVPVGFYILLQVNQSQGYRPILDWRWIWIEWEYLQFYGVEPVQRYGGLRIGVEVLVELLQDGVDLERALWGRKKG